ncbi:MAG: tetraacyldisaccharide 4'-kinase [Candidatus Omnitrophica bacterium]|nr:tetraacyldisaccharide 4'-kinase [Candidatus Omnitrophota bacterium]
MTDRISGPLVIPVKIALWALSVIYGLAIKVLSKGYEKKFFIPYRADCKVISIGNITVGGTGKTQAAIMMTRILEGLGRRAAVLIRGYGADEYKMLQEELRDVPVLVGADRIRNAHRAFYDFGADTLILDDGFQHFKIQRDMDIVLIDATNPFGNHELIPRGILREPVTALKRADLIIINKIDFEAGKLDEVYKVIAAFGKSDAVLESIYRPLELYEIASGRPVGLKAVRGKKVALVSSIANPAYFRQNISKLGAASIELEFAFPDHYDYKRADLDRIDRECGYFDVDFIVVTKKDAVKLKRLFSSGEFAVPVLVFDVEFAITKNEKLLHDRLSGLYIS